MFFTGPDTLASCGNLSLSGAQSHGGGGRPLVYEWELTYPNSGQDFTAISNLLAGLNEDADRVNIPGTLFETNTTYVFTFTVTNFFNEQGQVTHSIAKSAQPVPALTLSSDIDLNVGEIFVSEELSIKANALVSTKHTSFKCKWTRNDRKIMAKFFAILCTIL